MIGDQKLHDFLAGDGRFMRSIQAHRLRVILRREKGQCTWCGGPVPKGSRTWCNGGCVGDFNLRMSTEQIRRALVKRTGAKCERCGCCCRESRMRERWKSVAESRWNHPAVKFLTPRRHLDGKYVQNRRGRKNIRRTERLLRYMWKMHVRHNPGHRFEADHIVPVVEGGGLCGPEGYRLLCLPCHRWETRKLRKRLAKLRKSAKKT